MTHILALFIVLLRFQPFPIYYMIASALYSPLYSPHHLLFCAQFLFFLHSLPIYLQVIIIHTATHITDTIFLMSYMLLLLGERSEPTLSFCRRDFLRNYATVNRSNFSVYRVYMSSSQCACVMCAFLFRRVYDQRLRRRERERERRARESVHRRRLCDQESVRLQRPPRKGRPARRRVRDRAILYTPVEVQQQTQNMNECSTGADNGLLDFIPSPTLGLRAPGPTIDPLL